MSMIGKFVQVEPDRFKEILSDPSSVTELFVAKATAMEKFAGLTDVMRERMKRIAPSALAAQMEQMPPEIRERLAKQFEAMGVSLEKLKSGEGVDTLVNAMQARMGALRGQVQARMGALRGMVGGGSGGGGGGGTAPASSLSLEKDWHTIHYLMSGKAEPGTTLLSQVIMGGTEIGENDLGYGEARYFDAKKVADITKELSRGDLEAEMRARFDPAKMEAIGLYPGGWEPDEIDHLIEVFGELRDFFADANAHGRIVVTCLT